MAEGLRIQYYPNPQYIKKGQAAESIPDRQLEDIVRGAKIAQTQGVLSPRLAQTYISNSLIEKDPTLGLRAQAIPKTARFEQNLGKMGLNIAPQGQETSGQVAYKPFVTGQNRTGYEFPWNSPKYEDRKVTFMTPNSDLSSRAGPAVMAEKARISGEAKAPYFWNGAGPMARNHAAKVATMEKMMQHPMNEGLRQRVKFYEQRYSHGDVPRMSVDKNPIENDNKTFLTDIQNYVRDMTGY